MVRPASLFAPVKTARRVNSLAWMFEPLEREPGYVRTAMFGCLAAYVDGLLCLVAADRDASWNGLLLCTAREHHASLMQELPVLRPHSVLGKWLYAPQDDPGFEDAVAQAVRWVQERDPRVGVEPRPRKRR